MQTVCITPISQHVQKRPHWKPLAAPNAPEWKKVPREANPTQWAREQRLGEGSPGPQEGLKHGGVPGLLCPNMRGPEARADWEKWVALASRPEGLASRVSICWEEAAVHSSARGSLERTWSPQTTVWPVVLWEAPMGEQRGHWSVPCLSSGGKLKQYPFKVSFTEVLLYFPLKTNKNLITLSTLKTNGSQVLLQEKKSYFYFLASL